MKLKAKLRKTLSSPSLSARSRSKIIPTVPDVDSFCHSEPLESAHQRPSGAFTTLPSRLHKQDAQRVESAKLFNVETMSALSQSQPDFPCHLGSGAGHISSLLFPECLPERIDAVAVILEGAAFHHDMNESDDLGRAADRHRMMTSILEVGAPRPGQDLEGEKFVSQMVHGFSTKYGEEGQVLVKRILGNWLQPMELMKAEPASFEDCVSQRIVNAGTRVLWGLLEFSLGILLFEEEMKQIMHIVEVADRILVNTNDYFSWETGRESGDRAPNSIKVLMETADLFEQQAREKLRIEILKDEKKYQHLSKKFLQSSPNAPVRVRKFLTMLEILLGGHHIWCAAYKVHDSSSETEVSEEVTVCTVEPKSEVMDLHLGSCTTLDDSALLDPVHYIQSLPSKNMRLKVIDAFNVWFQLPDEQIDTIKAAIEDVHQSSLILDDIQDSSSLRRGFAATHHVFSSAQCINSATYMVARAASRIAAHQNHPQTVQTFLRGLKDMALGQSWDLSWRATGHCPSTAEYMAMVDGKTGAMFEMTIMMMQDFSAVEVWPMSELNQFAKILGRWYQVRDDYQNLQDEKYAAQKGFCEDLDEGKISYPLAVCCARDPVAQRIIMGIFRQREVGTPLALHVKMQILDLFRRSGALQHTWDILQELQRKAEAALSDLEFVIGRPNPNFRVVVSLLGNLSPRPPQVCT